MDIQIRFRKYCERFYKTSKNDGYPFPYESFEEFFEFINFDVIEKSELLRDMLEREKCGSVT